MKNEILSQSFNELADADEHDLFHLLKTAECIKVTAVIPTKEELTSLELAVYNFLLNHLRDFSSHRENFTVHHLKNSLGLEFSDDDLVNAFRNLDKKYYTECAFDDKGRCVWVRLL